MWYGMRLQSFREQSGLTRSDVCARTGFSPSTLAKIEAGITVPSIEQFIRLANSFRVRLPRLLMEVGVIQKKDMAVALKAVPLAAPTELGPRRRIQAKS
ncbi:MAG TPA: helix-turn-helix transcriptional regulator [Candidatus Acidoferrum sp.]|nr:helix-turn-helix transcriptional regulator [Candidatus Acidoferrum sp.]